MKKSLQERLEQVLLEGNLTVADLSRLFDRPYPTVRGWVNGVGLGGGQLDAAMIMAQIEKLERRIKSRNGLPVPRLAPSDRIKHVNQIRRSV